MLESGLDSLDNEMDISFQRKERARTWKHESMKAWKYGSDGQGLFIGQTW